MYRLIKIYELEQETDPTGQKWLAVDVEDPGSPTGFTTKKILVSTTGANTLNEVLTQGRETLGLPIDITEGDAVRFFQSGFNAALVPSVLSQNIQIKTPNESGVLALDQDTGWKKLPLFNGSYGVPNTGNLAYRPNIRIIGRELFFAGNFLIPMGTAAGASPTLDSNGIGYATNYYAGYYSGPGGFSVTTRDQLRGLSPILPAALLPTETFVFDLNQFYNRTVNLNGRTRLTHMAYQGAILSTGELIFNSIESNERNGLTGTGFTKSVHARKLVDIFQNGDDIMEYDPYRNSYSGGFVTDNRTVQDTGVNYTFDFDGSKAENLGGFFTRMEFSYSLDENLSLEQIQTAFDAL